MYEGLLITVGMLIGVAMGVGALWYGYRAGAEDGDDALRVSEMYHTQREERLRSANRLLVSLSNSLLDTLEEVTRSKDKAGDVADMACKRAVAAESPTENPSEEGGAEEESRERIPEDGTGGDDYTNPYPPSSLKYRVVHILQGGDASVQQIQGLIRDWVNHTYGLDQIARSIRHLRRDGWTITLNSDKRYSLTV